MKNHIYKSPKQRKAEAAARAEQARLVAMLARMPPAIALEYVGLAALDTPTGPGLTEENLDRLEELELRYGPL